MKKVYRVQTFDGKLHKDTMSALRHLDVMYTNTMSKIAAQLCDHCHGKYTETKEWLHNHLEELKEPMKIKADMPMEIDDDE